MHALVVQLGLSKPLKDRVVVRLGIEIKFEVEKFDGRNDFSLGRVTMCALLAHQGFSKH